MQISLRKGDLNICFPKTSVNCLVELAFDFYPFFSIQHPDAKLEI
jgi:hypothetical protein